MASGKPSTWLPLDRLVEQKPITLCNTRHHLLLLRQAQYVNFMAFFKYQNFAPKKAQRVKSSGRVLSSSRNVLELILI